MSNNSKYSAGDTVLIFGKVNRVDENDATLHILFDALESEEGLWFDMREVAPVSSAVGEAENNLLEFSLDAADSGIVDFGALLDLADEVEKARWQR
jgi:hypothetical protein